MVHLPEPGPDTGIFSTEEVRLRTKPCASTSRTIAFFQNQYKKPPVLAAGFRSLHLAHETPARAKLVVDNISTSSFRVALETWGKSTLYEASATWIEHKHKARDCQSGHFDTQDNLNEAAKPNSGQKGTQRENAKNIRFQRPFIGDCEVVCWLSRIDMAGGETNYRIRAYATNITPHGFTAHIDTWADSILNGAAMCWIAFPKNKASVQSGNFGTGDVRSWSNPKPKNSARLAFKEGSFKKPPTVLVALNFLDMAGNSDLRIKVDANEVDEQGFRWHLDTWVTFSGVSSRSTIC